MNFLYTILVLILVLLNYTAAVGDAELIKQQKKKISELEMEVENVTWQRDQCHNLYKKGK